MRTSAESCRNRRTLKYLRQKRRWASQALPFIGGAVTIASIAITAMMMRGSDWNDLWSPLATADLRWLGVALMLALLVEVGKTVRWQILLGNGPPFRFLIAALFTSRLLNALTPMRAGDVWRVAAGRPQISRGMLAAGAAVLTEKLLDAVALAIIGLVLLKTLSRGGLVLMLAAGCILALAVLTFAARGRLPAQFNQKIDECGAQLEHLRSRHILLKACFWTAAGMCGGAAVNALVLESLHVPIRIMPVLVMLVGGYTAGLVPSAPARLGVFELAVSAPLVSSGFATNESLLVALGLHVVILGSMLSGGLVALGIGLADTIARQTRGGRLADRAQS